MFFVIKIDSGLISRLQGIQWKRSWKLAEKHAIGGFVVSPEHEKFVRERITIGIPIVALPAGTEVNRFGKSLKKPDNALHFVYSGRLDSSRGTREMAQLVEHFDRLPMKATMRILGTGGEKEQFKELANSNERIIFLGQMDREDVWEELEKCHVGIMPMPDSNIWRTASPLKLAEYLAAGLLVVGPKHPGNSIDGNYRWDLLTENSDWPRRSIDLVTSTIGSGDWGEISNEARETANSLDWRFVAEKLKVSLEFFLGI